MPIAGIDMGIANFASLLFTISPPSYFTFRRSFGILSAANMKGVLK
jgi:hypothetical protein